MVRGRYSAPVRTSLHSCRFGRVGGQCLDLAATGEGVTTDLEGVQEIHRLKTAALLSAAAEMGAVVAGAPEAVCQSMAAYGSYLGLCFQAVDDLLDVTGDAQTLGKTPGKDERSNKATLVSALGQQGAEEQAQHWADLARTSALQAGCSPESLCITLLEWVQARQR